MTFFLLSLSAFGEIELNDGDQCARKSHSTVYDVVTTSAVAIVAQLTTNSQKQEEERQKRKKNKNKNYKKNE